MDNSQLKLSLKDQNIILSNEINKLETDEIIKNTSDQLNSTFINNQINSTNLLDQINVSAINSNISFDNDINTIKNTSIIFLKEKYSNMINERKFNTLMETKKELEKIFIKYDELLKETEQLINKFLEIRIVKPGIERNRILQLVFEKDLLTKVKDGLKLVIDNLNLINGNIQEKDKINETYQEFFTRKIFNLDDKVAIKIIDLIFTRELIRRKLQNIKDAIDAKDYILNKRRNLDLGLIKEINYLGSNDKFDLQIELSNLDKAILNFKPLEFV